MFPPGLLELQLGHPNQLFFLIAAGLAFIVPLTWALKLTVAASSVIFILGAARLCRHLRCDVWSLSLVVPISLGFSYYFGLQACQLSTGFLLAGLVDLDRFIKRPSTRSLFGALLWLPALHLAHQQALVIYSGASALFALGYLPSIRAVVVRAVPFLGGLSSVLLQLLIQKQQLQDTAIVSADPIFLPIKERLSGIFMALFGAHMRVTSIGFGIVFAVAILVLIVLRIREERFRWPGVLAALRDWRFQLLALCNMLFYFFAPNSFNTANYIAERFLPWAVLIGIISLGPRTAPIPRVIRACLFLVPLAYGVSMVPALREVEAQAQHLEKLIPFIEPGSSIALLDADIAEPNMMFTTLYGDSIVAARLGGRPLHSFAYTTISVVRFQRQALWQDSLKRMMIPKTFNFRPAIDFTAFRYVILKSQSVAKNQLFSRLLMPEGRFVASTGYWTLLESTLPVRPVTAPFGKPGYCGDSVGDRLLRVMDLVNERDWLETGVEIGGACTTEGGEVGAPVEQVVEYMAWALDQANKARTLEPNRLDVD